MKISIIIPTHNRAQLLEKLLKSIYRSSYKDYEVIVVDDASTDNTCAIVKRYDCKYVYNEINKGAGYSRNTGATAAIGGIFVFIDSDVIIQSDTLHNIIDNYMKNPNVYVMCGYKLPVNLSSAFGSDIVMLRKTYVAAKWLQTGKSFGYNSFLETALCAIKRSVFEELGGFPNDYTGAGVEDHVFGHRIIERYDIYFFKNLGVYHHFESLSSYFATVVFRTYRWAKIYTRRWRFEARGVATKSEGINAMLSFFMIIGLGVTIIRKDLLFIPGLLFGIFLIRRIDFYLYISKKKPIRYIFYIMLIDILLYFINGVIGLFVVISSILHRIFLFFRFLGEVKKILSSKTPVNFGFFVTSKCNMLCKHCFYWKEIIDAKNRKELSLEEIMQISKNLDTMYYLTITGGEPSLREDLPLICKVFYDNNCARMFSYHTNGYDTKAIVSQITDIMNLCPDAKVNVGISLDGPKDIHDVVRGRNGSYDRAIRTLKELRKCQVNSQNLDIQMCGTFSNYTYKKAKRFSRSIREKYGVYHGWTLIRGNPNCSTAKKVSAEDYISIHNVLRKTEDKRRFHSSLYWFIRQIVGRQIPLTIFFILKKKRQIIPCLAGNRTIVLYDNGDVAPCEVLEKNMGNIREFNYDMKKLLGNPRALQILNIISSKRCHCTHEGNLYVNLIFNFRTYLRALNSYIKTIR